MAFPDITADLKARMPQLRGRLLANQPLAELTWFRVGGPAQVLFMPEDESDLAHFLQNLPVRNARHRHRPRLQPDRARRRRAWRGDPARPRLQRRDYRSRAIACAPARAVPDVKVARAAQEASIAGLAFYRGIPGAIGGALRMNGGAYGRETKDVLIEARAVDRAGRVHVLSNADMHYSYRHCGAPEDFIFTQALFQGAAGDPAAIAAEMDKITESREATQPIKSRTGGSTFKNPPGAEGVAVDRRRRLPRAYRRQGAGLGTALQFPDQSRRRQRGRHRDAWAKPCASG